MLKYRLGVGAPSMKIRLHSCITLGSWGLGPTAIFARSEATMSMNKWGHGEGGEEKWRRMDESLQIGL